MGRIEKVEVEMVVCICRYILGQRKTTEKVNVTKQRRRSQKSRFK